MRCPEGHVRIHDHVDLGHKRRSGVVDPHGINLPDFGAMRDGYVCDKLLDLYIVRHADQEEELFLAVGSQTRSTKKERMMAPIGTIHYFSFELLSGIESSN